ncbi:MAG: Serine/threonine-protein kinase PknD [Phycisphaerae bacterium]|nr:Serine/threonine-protein kinase PknD [Phycisphaerae bacterium]
MECLIKHEDLHQMDRGELSARRQEEINDHLMHCRPCRELMLAHREESAILPLARSAWQSQSEFSNFTPPAPAITRPSLPTEQPPPIPGYEIIREVHRGGQGVIYEAVQLSTKRLTALKVLAKGQLLDPRRWQRFELEVELAASLRHPNIVPIYDRGMVKGYPFYSMALVRGRRLSDYLTQQRLSLDETLQLFFWIIQAVSYAHRHGVMHRDLKPSNVLVDETGQPHLLDFGLARRIVEDSPTLRLTETHEFAGTLAYAAPEQVDASLGRVNTASDVYALGVMMYEALTGHMPYTTEGVILDVVRQITETQPLPPRRRRPDLDPDLDFIIQKALHKDPQQRYPSAAELLEDLRRYRHGEPVLARGPSTLYVVRKLINRHRVFAAGLTGILLGLAGVAIVSVQYGQEMALQRNLAWNAKKQEAEARRTAERAQELSQRINSFLQQMLYSVDPIHEGSTVSLLTMLNSASAQVRTDFRDHPDVVGQLLVTLGTCYTSLGLYTEGEEQLSEAVQVLSAYFGPHSLEAVQAKAELARSIGLQRDDERTLNLWQEIIFDAESLPQTDDLIIRGLGNIAGLYIEQGNLTTAQLYLYRANSEFAFAMSQELPETYIVYNALGLYHFQCGEYNLAEQYLLTACRILEKDPLEKRRNLPRNYSNLGGVYLMQDRMLKARETLHEALMLVEKSYGPNHPEMAPVLLNLAMTEIAPRRRYDTNKAQEYVDRAKEIVRANSGDQHRNYALCLYVQGRIFAKLKRPAEAAEAFEQALAIERQTLPDRHIRMVGTLAQLGFVYYQLDRKKEADQVLTEADSILVELAPRHPLRLAIQAGRTFSCVQDALPSKLTNRD